MGTRERRQREKQERRGRILGAAREVFGKRGYTAATISELAGAAELAPGTLYLYFPSKDAIYAELLAEGYELLRQRLEESVRPVATPRRQAEALIDGFLGFARERPEYFDMMFFLLQREGSNREGRLDAQQVRRLGQLEDRCREVAGRVLGRAGAGGDRRHQATLDAVWTMLAGVVFYFRNDPSFAAVGARAKRLLLAAIFPNQ
jgi:AcrR family transcriptional regulator